MRSLLTLLLAIAFVPAAFATTVFVHCTPSGGSGTIGNSLEFNNGVGSGSFSCSDAGQGLGPLVSVSVQLFVDYQDADSGGGSNDNSAGFTFTNSATTWANANAGVGTTMALNTGSGVTLFAVGDLSSDETTFTNSTSGGTGGTVYIQPATDAVTGTLLDSFTINLSAFVDAGNTRFGSASSAGQVTAIFSDAVPEPISFGLAGAGLLALSILSRRRLSR